MASHRVEPCQRGPESEDDEDDDDSPEALAASIDALDDDIAVLIARDMLRLYELAADRPDHSLRGALAAMARG